MKKIGICFPEKDFIRLPEENFIKYITILKESGLYSFDFYTDFIIKYKPTKPLLNLLNKNKIRLTFHYNGEILKNEKEVIRRCQLQLKTLRKILDSNNHKYQTVIVFHVPDYVGDKYEHLRSMIDMFKKISDFCKRLRFDVLIETLSSHHPEGVMPGTSFSEIVLFLNEISNRNFGVCWDIGHTRLNHIENHDHLFIPSKLIKRVKFVHLHNIYLKDGQYNEHIPITNLKLQDDEINYLIENGYRGIYSLEYEMESLKENISVYVDNIKKIQKYIESYGVDQIGIRKNSQLL